VKRSGSPALGLCLEPLGRLAGVVLNQSHMLNGTEEAFVA